MRWLDRAKDAKQKQRDKLEHELDRERAKEKAKEEKAEAEIAPALAPYGQVAKEFCEETEWTIYDDWKGGAGDKSLEIRSATKHHSHVGTSFEYHDTAWIRVTSPPLRTRVAASKAYGLPWDQKFEREFSGISERNLKKALEAFYLWY